MSVAHGGAVATVLDLCLAFTGTVNCSSPCPTASMALQFKRSEPTPGLVVLRTRITDAEEREKGGH